MVNIYVGRQRDSLVLKYLEGEKELCHFYPLGENETDTIVDSGKWLKYGGMKKVRFSELKDPEHEIFPFDFDAIKLIRRGYRQGFSAQADKAGLNKRALETYESASIQGTALDAC